MIYEDGGLRRGAVVIEAEGAPSSRKSAVVYEGDEGGGYLLTSATSEDGGALIYVVRLQSVAAGLVE